MAKAIAPERHFRIRELSSIDDERWNELQKHIPQSLTAEADARFRSGILECCSSFLTENDRFEEGRRTFAAMQSHGKGQPTGLERLAKGLRMAADAWAELRGIHDDRLGDIRRYDDLEGMAQDAERRLTGLRKLGEPVTVTDPWPVFVREVANCCRALGLKPTATGRVYEGDGKPTWFQKFMAALNDNLLGDEGNGPDILGDRGAGRRKAFYAEIAKAMRGNRKPGKARK